MSNFLALDTSSRYLTVLVKKGAKRVLRFIPDCATRHSVVLMGEIDAALSEAGLKPDECDFFAAVTGPGSFTGIRIGVSTAKGFAAATGKKLMGVTSFDLVAYNVEKQKFYVIIDAAHEHFYVCGYSGGEIIFAPSYLPRSAVEELRAPLYGFEDIKIANYNRVEIQSCLDAAVEHGELSDTLEALYVRKSQAEEARSGN